LWDVVAGDPDRATGRRAKGQERTDVGKSQKSAGLTDTSTTSVKIGKITPPFTAETLDGKQLNLKDYRGKVVILYFGATRCKPCVAGTPELKKFYRDLKASFGNDFEMISLSMDDIERSASRMSP
jgi:cytochrome oxidase Cu insertion factor (SCO1/SenC/PrrC family)